MFAVETWHVAAGAAAAVTALLVVAASATSRKRAIRRARATAAARLDLPGGLERLALILRRGGEGRWAKRLDQTASRVAVTPAEAAVEILTFYDKPDAFQDVSPRRWPQPVRIPSPLWEEVLEFSSRRMDVYRQAVALWHATRPRPTDEAGPGPVRPQKLADWGVGNEVWRHHERWWVRRATGTHVTFWRDDDVTPDEAAQAMLGAPHFTFMVFALEERLQAAGQDPWTGSATPLPEPS